MEGTFDSDKNTKYSTVAMVRVQVLTAKMGCFLESCIVWSDTYRRFRGAYCLDHQDDKYISVVLHELTNATKIQFHTTVEREGALEKYRTISN
jgi:hypothetical protein